VHVFQPNTAEWHFRPGPIFTSLLLVDELNRATPKAQSALLEAMAERQVTVDGDTMVLPNPFMVIATQNPMGEAGTHAMAHAQLDRFAARLNFGLPGRAAERQILTGETGAHRLSETRAVLGEGELQHMFASVAHTHACDSVLDYVLAVVDVVRGMDPSIWLSVRVSQTLLAVSRGIAFMSGRDYVAPEDVQAAAPAVMSHRLPRSLDQEGIDAMVQRLPVPTDAH